MPPTGYFLDTNLLILYVVGREGTHIIPKHKRLSGYSEEDFSLLQELLEPVRRVLVTPNTLTETSNLLAQHANPERDLLLEMLRYIIQESEEVVVASADASLNDRFVQLGLTDAALLEAITEDTPLITVDVRLWQFAIERGIYSAINFNPLRRP